MFCRLYFNKLIYLSLFCNEMANVIRKQMILNAIIFEYGFVFFKFFLIIILGFASFWVHPPSVGGSLLCFPITPFFCNWGETAQSPFLMVARHVYYFWFGFLSDRFSPFLKSFFRGMVWVKSLVLFLLSRVHHLCTRNDSKSDWIFSCFTWDHLKENGFVWKIWMVSAHGMSV